MLRCKRDWRQLFLGKSQFGTILPQSQNLLLLAIRSGDVMGAWALFGSGFFVGLCVGQLALAFFLGLARKDHPDIFPALERES